MLNNLFNLPENRAISFQSIWGAGDTFAFTTESGAAIDEASAMRISAFYACVLLISDTISTLPVDSYVRRDGNRVPYRPRPKGLVGVRAGNRTRSSANRSDGLAAWRDRSAA